MRYNGFYYGLFQGSMRRTLAQRYGKEFAREVMTKAKPLYRQLVIQAPDIGDDNPMAYNELFALAFAAPYLASERRIQPTDVQEMMAQALHSVRWFFALTDVNTPRGKRGNQKAILEYQKWYTPERQEKYPNSFLVDFEGKPYADACYYRITRCPICAYFQQLGIQELMPLMCQLDENMVSYQHGILHRQYTIASGGPYCDYYIVGDKEKPPLSKESL